MQFDEKGRAIRVRIFRLAESYRSIVSILSPTSPSYFPIDKL